MGHSTGISIIDDEGVTVCDFFQNVGSHYAAHERDRANAELIVAAINELK